MRFYARVQFKDYYAVLGVTKTATQDEIRKAFRKLARTHHPDVAKDKKTAESKFKEINEANEVLSDPEKRKRYDELGADWNSPGRQGPPPGSHRGGGMDFGGGDGGAFSDFFEAFFGGGGGKKRKSGFGAFAQRGADAELELAVTIEEALHGGRQALTLDRAGRTETVTVNIPRGVRASQKIRLAGQGNEGIGGGERGDLYLRVKIAPHLEYRTDGFDLIRAVPVPVWSAVLGGEVEVLTPDGTVKMKIPTGTQPGQKFRLKGRGLPSGKDTRGDFFAEAKVLLPTSLGDKERALWEQLAGSTQ
ncbi:MAG: DnaJ C-terminal domain-containing protein [Chthoniobacteraceae bacterium]